MSVTKIPEPEERCDICHKRKAEFLCNMPMFRGKMMHLKKENGVTDYENSFKWTTLTCDRKMCSKCATEVGGDIHFCKRCVDRLRKILMRC